MDFCLSKNKPHDIRYDKVCELTGGLCVAWHTNGNIKNIGTETSPILVLGNLFGQLRTSRALRTGDPDELGNDALHSDGAFTLIIPFDERITIVTDTGGSIPVFWGYGSKGLAVGTVVHHVSHLSGCEKVDYVSVVDYLVNENVCYPWTWYIDIKSLPPASVCTLDLKGNISIFTYWQPTEPDTVHTPADVREWGIALRETLKHVIDTAIQDTKNGRVLFSGGEDSRAVASMLPPEFDCKLTTILDRKNREYRLAKRAARWLGRSFQWVPRPMGFYRSNIPQRIDMIGPGFDFRHTHFFYPISCWLNDVDVLIGGYLADSLFKTFYMVNVKKRRGRPEVLLKPDRSQFKVLRNKQLCSIFRDDIVEELWARRQQHHHRLSELRPLTAGNWHSIWPIFNNRAIPSYLCLLRIGPRAVEPFLFSSIYRLAAKMPDTCRVNSRAFRHAFATMMGKAGWLPTSSRKIPRLDERSASLFSYLAARYLSLRHRFNSVKLHEGSWSADHDGWVLTELSEYLNPKAVEHYEERISCIVHNPTDMFRGYNGNKSFQRIKIRSVTLGLY